MSEPLLSKDTVRVGKESCRNGNSRQSTKQKKGSTSAFDGKPSCLSMLLIVVTLYVLLLSTHLDHGGVLL